MPINPGSATVEAVAATVGDAAELLGVQMDQVTGSGMRIAADRPPGRPVQAGQPVAAMTDQDPMDRRGRQTEPSSDPGRAEPLAAAQPQDALLDLGGGPPGLW